MKNLSKFWPAVIDEVSLVKMPQTFITAIVSPVQCRDSMISGVCLCVWCGVLTLSVLSVFMFCIHGRDEGPGPVLGVNLVC